MKIKDLGMKSFSQFDDNKNNNFNLIRLFAALLVIYTHSYGLLGLLPDKQNNPFAYFIYLLGNVGVDMFFLVSGFLVTRSYITRHNLGAFLWARVLRIYPGLLCAILFSVFVIGLFETRLSIKEYLLHKDVFRYIAVNLSLTETVLNLPGVFEQNFYKNQVNGSLWTLPAEIRLYLYVAIFGVLGVFFKRLYLNTLLCGFLILYLISPGYIPLISDNTLYFYPALLFALGCLFYMNKAYIPSSRLIVIVLFLLLLYVVYFKVEYKSSVYTVFMAYFVFWFAYNVPFLNVFNKVGDYSYGLYIYAFPIQQLIASRYSGISVNLFFLFSLLLSLFLAVLSWHLVEKKALKLKR